MHEWSIKCTACLLDIYSFIQLYADYVCVRHMWAILALLPLCVHYNQNENE